MTPGCHLWLLGLVLILSVSLIHCLDLITTIAGDGGCGYSGDGGASTSAVICGPQHVKLDSSGIYFWLTFIRIHFLMHVDVGNIIIADTGNVRIRKITISTGIISNIAGCCGTDGYNGDGIQATSAQLYYPHAAAADSSGNCSVLSWFHDTFHDIFNVGNIYIADDGNGRIRKVTISTGIITTFAGTGSHGYSGDGGAATSAMIQYPYDITLDSVGTLSIDTFALAILLLWTTFPI